MKVIDLLNKISNGEDVPKKIKYRDWLYEFEKDCNDYMCQYDSLLYRENDDVRQFLNDEVEIIEEFTKEDFIKERMKLDGITIEQFNKKYEVKKCNCGMPYCRGFIAVEKIVEDKKIEKLNKMHFHKKQRQLANKINEIIDKLNEMDEDV